MYSKNTSMSFLSWLKLIRGGILVFDKLNLKDLYVCLISRDTIIISHYNEARSAIIEYVCNETLTDVKTTIWSLTEASESTSIRNEASGGINARITRHGGSIHTDEETAHYLLNHLCEVARLETDIKAYCYDKMHK